MADLLQLENRRKTDKNSKNRRKTRHGSKEGNNPALQNLGVYILRLEQSRRFRVDTSPDYMSSAQIEQLQQLLSSRKRNGISETDQEATNLDMLTTEASTYFEADKEIGKPLQFQNSNTTSSEKSRNIYLRLKDSFNTYSDSRTRNHTLAFFVIFFWRGLRSSVGEYKIAEEAHIKAIQIDEKSVEACGHLAQFSFVAGELEHARVHPKFLHSNATSHKWAFGAIAELLDNAVDEVNNGATFVKVDRVYSKIDNSPSLLFLDDGGGMDPDGMRKCMSLCYSTKKTNNTIGQYGNGFKTSTMQLGDDVIVFSRACRNGRATQSVGLLSYTFLRKTGQDDVIVPMIDFDISKHWSEPILYGTQEDWSTNLKTILEWSPFNSKDDLIQQDIKLIDETAHLSKLSRKAADKQSHISYRLLHSLRAYASMLYLRKFKNFKIILRGKPVEQYIISDDLKYPEVVIYKPQVSSAKQILER
ncbi:hypothetical protein R6Q59_006553 [Mikania micrantha]